MISNERLESIIADANWRVRLGADLSGRLAQQEDEKANMARELLALRERYAFAENQRLCVGDAGGCDGDLEGTEHEQNCPARANDLTLRPHLYEPSPKEEAR